MAGICTGTSKAAFNCSYSGAVRCLWKASVWSNPPTLVQLWYLSLWLSLFQRHLTFSLLPVFSSNPFRKLFFTPEFVILLLKKRKRRVTKGPFFICVCFYFLFCLKNSPASSIDRKSDRCIWFLHIYRFFFENFALFLRQNFTVQPRLPLTPSNPSASSS